MPQTHEPVRKVNGLNYVLPIGVVVSLIGLAFHAGTVAQRVTAEEQATVRAALVLEKLVDKVDNISAQLAKHSVNDEK